MNSHLKEILLNKMVQSEELQQLYFELGRHDLEQYHKGIFDTCQIIYNTITDIERGVQNDTSH